MANNTINIKALAEEFKVECKVIKLGYEYPGYTGIEKYAIVTDLSYAQIMGRYAPVAEHYCPFLLLSKAAGEVIADFKRNEDKFSKRMQKDDCYGFEDSTTFSMSGMRLKQVRKSVRCGRTRQQTASVSVPPSHLDMSETHRTKRNGW